MNLITHNLRPILFDDFINDFFGNINQNNTPLYNIFENDKEYKIEFSVPGFDKKQFSVEIENDILRVSNNSNTFTPSNFACCIKTAPVDCAAGLSNPLDSKKPKAVKKTAPAQNSVAKKMDNRITALETKVSDIDSKLDAMLEILQAAK